MRVGVVRDFVPGGKGDPNDASNQDNQQNENAQNDKQDGKKDPKPGADGSKKVAICSARFIRTGTGRNALAPASSSPTAST